MNDTHQFDELRSQYRARWDAHQALAHKNAELRQNGRQPSNEQVAEEQRAASAVAEARDALLTIICGLWH
jgi:hypothetical protein